MVDGHQHAVEKFKAEKGKAQAQPVEAVVTATLPILDQHLALAQAVQSEISRSGLITVCLTSVPQSAHSGAKFLVLCGCDVEVLMRLRT